MKIEDVGIIESEKSHWELIRLLGNDGEETNQMKLLYVPSGGDYSDEDNYIITDIERVKDLLKMLKGINL